MTDVASEGHVVKADRGVRYPIRLFNCVNGTLLIGFFIGGDDSGALYVLRPHEVEYEVEVTEEESEIVSYSLCPYLDQLAEYDPLTLYPTPFMQSAFISVSVPSPSLLRLFNAQVAMAEHVATHTEDVSYRELAMERSSSTLH